MLRTPFTAGELDEIVRAYALLASRATGIGEMRDVLDNVSHAFPGDVRTSDLIVRARETERAIVGDNDPEFADPDAEAEFQEYIASVRADEREAPYLRPLTADEIAQLDEVFAEDPAEDYPEYTDEDYDCGGEEVPTPLPNSLPEERHSSDPRRDAFDGVPHRREV